MIFELSSSLVVESFESEQEKEEEDQSESYKSPVTAQTSGGDTEGGTIGYKLESEIGKIEDSFEQSKEPNSSPVSEDGSGIMSINVIFKMFTEHLKLTSHGREKVFDVYHKLMFACVKDFMSLNTPGRDDSRLGDPATNSLEPTPRSCERLHKIASALMNWLIHICLKGA
uniref:(California timema) hypothetical protein n=1 Tax=Timema californicum TaxID=61474 RepID=A0A7R9J539_TIMCA|nr:unnamed protein product [Timema californicum]